MMRFLNRIRRKLLSDNKFRRYLFYAFGEIVLVVVGILIALQINNWNESRKMREREILQLKNIQEDLSLDIPDVMFNLTYHKLFLKSEQELLQYISGQNRPQNKEIKYEEALGISLLLIIHESAFNNFRNNNLSTMSNQKLKKDISNHYDSYTKALLIFENDHVQVDNYSLKWPYFLKYFNYQKKVSSRESVQNNSADYYNPEIELNKLVLADTAGILKDEEFRMVLAKCISNSKIMIQFYEHFLIKNRELDQAIELELDRLQG